MRDRQHVVVASAVTTAVQIAVAYANASAEQRADICSDDNHNALLERFETWEELAQDIGAFATAVEHWTEGRYFNNWYEMVDAFAEVYLHDRLEVDDYNVLIARALVLEPPDVEGE